MKRIVLIMILCLCGTTYSAEKQWNTNRPILEILEATKENMKQYEGGEVDLQQLGRLKEVDLEISAYGLTKERYYRFDIHLRSPIRRLWKFDKSIEIWGSDNNAVVRSTVDIGYGKTRRFPFRWINCVKDCIIDQVENMILDIEQQKLKEFTESSVVW